MPQETQVRHLTPVLPTRPRSIPNPAHNRVDLRQEWRNGALCLNADRNYSVPKTAWSLDSNADNPNPFEATLKKICGECPVRTACLRDAVLDRESQGVRAGFAFNDGGCSGPDGSAMRREFGFRVTARMRASERTKLVAQLDRRTQEAGDGEARYSSAV